MKKLYPYFLLVLSVLTFNQSKAQVDKNDSLALVDLYNSTNGPGWTNHTNWLTSSPLSTWFGAHVFGTRVTDLRLTVNNLNGPIPASIGNLTSLIILQMESNTLTGNLPSSMGNLVKLTRLYLMANQLTGVIPDAFGKMTSLSDFEISHNQLTGISDSLSNLQNLIYLFVDNNQLRGKIPHFLNNMPNLQYLILSYNQLSGAIPSLSKMTHLAYIDFGHNKLTGTISLKLDSLKNLYNLSLNNNQLTGNIPAYFRELKNLERIDLNDNNLSGQIPSLDSLKYLYHFNLQNNKFTFTGIEKISTTFSFAVYSPQANLTINQNGNLLSVDAGGTIANNTYKWYRNGKLYRTKVGNANLSPSNDGAYTVEVTNSVATQLTLKSDTVNYAAFNNLNTSAATNTLKSAYIFPNPATTVTTIYFTAIGKYTVTVTDASGKVIKTKTDVAANYHNYIQLEVNGYASGVYLISISDEKGLTQTLRLIKE